MATPTQRQLTLVQSSIIDIYQSLEQTIFKLFAKYLVQNGVPAKGAKIDDILRWQVARLAELGVLNKEGVAMVAESTGIAKTQLQRLFGSLGYAYAQGEYKRIGKATGHSLDPQNIDQLMAGYLKQTFRELDNNVNQTLLTTNYGKSAITKTYQQIVKEATARAITGVVTPHKAIAQTVYKWRDQGLDMGLIDKGGHHWGMTAYARVVVSNTTHRAYQAVRDQAADDYGIDIFVMSSHPASRRACAQIQGHLVTTRQADFVTDDHQHVYSLFNWGFGTPGGTFGINCRHQKWAFVPGVNTNNQTQYNPDEAISNGDVQARQRALERQIRKYKEQQALAEELQDDEGRQKYATLIRNNQAGIRGLVKDHSFLTRDRSREQADYTPQQIKQIAP